MVVSKHAGNDISRELSYSKRSNRGKYTARNIKLYDEYKASGAEYTMTFIEYKKKHLKMMKAKNYESDTASKLRNRQTAIIE